MTTRSLKNFEITVVGSGYVGMSLGALLSQKNKVTIHDIDPERVEKVNNRIPTISDNQLKDFFAHKELKLRATLNGHDAYSNADFVIIAVPTDYDEISGEFNTNIIDSVVQNILEINSRCLIVIKSTVPVGYTDKLKIKYKTKKIIFSPEFLREGFALYDNQYPSRIIIGGSCDQSIIFGEILKSEAKNKDKLTTLHTSASEAEAIKLFSNTYLAMRVSFFNELDSYALSNNLNTKNIIDGVSLDSRIGSHYNNPSFGYGGYCLPKDTKQLLSNYDKVPQSLIQAIVSSNSLRKEFIAKQIIDKRPKYVGIYRLIMKEGSSNFRSSAIIDIIETIKNEGISVVIYEPLFLAKTFAGNNVIKSLDEFKKISDLIIANRHSKELDDVSEKYFSRDIYGSG